MEPDPRLDPQRISLEGAPVPMSLAEIVTLAFDQNLSIEISFKDIEIAREGKIAETGIYDPLLGATAGYRKIEGESNQANFGGTGSGSSASRFVTKDGTTVIDQHGEEMGVSLSQLVPTGATLSIGFDRTRTKYEDIREISSPLNPEEDHRAYVRVTQPLLKNFGPKVTNLGIRVATIEQKIAASLYRQEVENQIAEVMSAYWDLVFSIRNLEVQRTSLEAALELERVNEVRVRTGSAPRSDLYQAQAQVASRRNSVIAAKSSILAAQDRLLRLVNWSQPLDSWDRPIAPTDQPTNYDLTLDMVDGNLVAEAVMNRNDLRAARLSLDAAETTKDALWWQRFPELNAIAEYGLNGMDSQSNDAFKEVSNSDYEDYFVGVEMKYPLFNRRARADYRRSKKRMERAELNINQLELAVTTQVRAASRSIRTAQESIEASDAQVRAAEETLTSERKRLDVGSSTTFNVLQFQEDLAEAQVNQVVSMVNYQKGMIELHRSRGTLLDRIGDNLGLVFEFDELAVPEMDE